MKLFIYRATRKELLQVIDYFLHKGFLLKLINAENNYLTILYFEKKGGKKNVEHN